jgi:polar amino acid transport system permease protein
MPKQHHHSILKNKTFGHVLAVLFFIGVGYLFFTAASNMNYIWKWTSVPKYFAYEKVITEDAPFDGVVSIQGDKLTIQSNDGEEHTISLDGELSPTVADGDVVFMYGTVASTTQWTAGPLLMGLKVTLQISAISALLALIIGTIVAFMRMSSYQFFNDIGAVYVTIIRGTPLLVQIFIFYFIIATIFELDRFLAGAMSLGIFFGGYIAEVLRGAIQSIDKGQYEAAKSLGMNYAQTMTFIIMPQALKRALPTLVGEMIALVKDSSLVSVISITDLTKVGREIVANTFSPFETWLIIAGMYFSITAILSYVGHRIEKRMRKQGGM